MFIEKNVRPLLGCVMKFVSPWLRRRVEMGNECIIGSWSFA
jgi:hypothetical protein